MHCPFNWKIARTILQMSELISLARQRQRIIAEIIGEGFGNLVSVVL